VKGFRARQYTCEAQVAKFDEALRARVTPPPAAPDGTAPPQDRTYRDQTAERRSLEQGRERSLVCAQQAAAQLGYLKGSQGASPVAAASEEAFQQDTAAVLELIRRAGESASSGPYETFAKSIETLRARLATYRNTHQVLIARNPDAARRLVVASDALFSVGQAWELEVRAGRDAAGFRADIEAAMRRDATVTARASLPNSQRGLEGANNAQAAAARARMDALSRLNSSLAGLQTLDVPPTSTR
jgi:hypothetical protein